MLTVVFGFAVLSLHCSLAAQQMRIQWYANDVLSSGTYTPQEVSERMTMVLMASAPSPMKIMVVTPPDGEIFTIGAKTLPLRGSVVPVRDQRAPGRLASNASVKPEVLLFQPSFSACEIHVTSFQSKMECVVPEVG